VFVLSDLDIGMNDWMCPELKWDDNYRPDRGKVLSKTEIEALPKSTDTSTSDDDGIPVPDAAGRVAEGCVLHALDPDTTSTAATPRTPKEYQVVHGPAGAQVPSREGSVPRP
jgi:2-oxoglutarate ferredoxin oxidoreductase subunit alpha